MILNLLKQTIRKTFNTVGIEVHRFVPENSSSARLLSALRKFEIDVVVDIGANNGQFAKELRAGGFKHQIISFEPLTSAHAKLIEASKYDPDWQIHSRCAIGDQIGEIEINIASNSVSSSILPMLSEHSNAAPQSIYLGSEKAEITTVDKAVLPYLFEKNAPLLKIDTQGYEWHVLNGATLTLPKVKGILMELSLVPLYEGQHLWLECIARLNAEGFTLWSLEPAFIDPLTGRTLQWDGLFFRQ